MSAKNSKFSGIFAQAREREVADSVAEPTPIETPIAPELVAEDRLNPPQEPLETAPKATQSAPKEPLASRKTPAYPRLKGQLSPMKSAPQVVDEASETRSKTTRNGRPRGKRSDPNYTQITAYISKQTHQNVKLALLNEGQKREISELIEDQLTAWLAQKTD